MAYIRSLLSISALLSASVAHALLLGGVNVPKEKIVVYLMIGHSNIAGVDGAHADGVPHARGWTYQMLSSKTWVPAKETPGTNRANGLSTGRGIAGPSMPFLKQMATAYPDYHFGVVINASPSSTCKGVNTGNNGSDMDPDDNRYWKGARLYTEIVAAAKAIQADVTLGGIVCMLGAVEATRTPETVCRSFSNDLAQLAKDLRTDLNSPQLPFIMGEYEQGASGTFSPSLPMPAVIVSEIKLLPTKLEQSATISSAGIAMLDDHHYVGNVGQQEFAKRVVTTLQTRKWFPPPGGTAISPRLTDFQSVKSNPNRLEFIPSQGRTLAAKGGHLYLIDGSFQKPERTHAIPSL